MTIVADYPVPPDKDDPRFRRFYVYWRDKGGNGLPPMRKDIDPIEIPDLLGYINIIRVHRTENAIRFQYVLWGTRVAELYGGDFTGKYLEEIMLPTKLNHIYATLRTCVEDCAPHFWDVPVPRPNRDFIGYRRLLLPLIDDAGAVTHLVALMLPNRKE